MRIADRRLVYLAQSGRRSQRAPSGGRRLCPHWHRVKTSRLNQPSHWPIRHAPQLRSGLPRVARPSLTDHWAFAAHESHHLAPTPTRLHGARSTRGNRWCCPCQPRVYAATPRSCACITPVFSVVAYYICVWLIWKVSRARSWQAPRGVGRGVWRCAGLGGATVDRADRRS